ncbi:MAG TPA: hypothetical protein VL424_14595, partial [Pararobbsia sp.]|nr:hypothetical protein [Pararobbsia sp.]
MATVIQPEKVERSRASTARAAHTRMRWFAVRKELSPRARLMLGIGSFVLPLLVWCIVSYVPFVWHPLLQISNPGGVDYFQNGMLVDKATFANETANMVAAHKPLPA